MCWKFGMYILLRDSFSALGTVKLGDCFCFSKPWPPGWFSMGRFLAKIASFGSQVFLPPMWIGSLCDTNEQNQKINSFFKRNKQTKSYLIGWRVLWSWGYSVVQVGLSRISWFNSLASPDASLPLLTAILSEKKRKRERKQQGKVIPAYFLLRVFKEKHWVCWENTNCVRILVKTLFLTKRKGPATPSAAQCRDRGKSFFCISQNRTWHCGVALQPTLGVATTLKINRCGPGLSNQNCSSVRKQSIFFTE